MKGEWCYYKSYFSPDYCNSIIEKSKGLQFQRANLGEDGLSANNNRQRRFDLLQKLVAESFERLDVAETVSRKQPEESQLDQ